MRFLSSSNDCCFLLNTLENKRTTTSYTIICAYSLREKKSCDLLYMNYIIILYVHGNARIHIIMRQKKCKRSARVARFWNRCKRNPSPAGFAREFQSRFGHFTKKIGNSSTRIYIYTIIVKRPRRRAPRIATKKKRKIDKGIYTKYDAEKRRTSYLHNITNLLIMFYYIVIYC